MIYELRTYHVAPNRMPALPKRFETITLDLFKKHGIRQAGFWTTMVGESNQNMFYMLAWESLAEREKKWTAFATDPEWLTKRAETEKGRPDCPDVIQPIPGADSVLVGKVRRRP
jgi:hypothetical protein